MSAEVPAHGSVLLRLVVTPVPRKPFKGEALAIPGKIEMEDFDVTGVGAGNTSYNEMDTENHGDSDYRPGTGVDLYEKATGVIVGYNQAGEWLEYTVNVAADGEYTMFAAVASANETSSFQLSVDGKNITEEIAVPKAASGDENYDDYNKVKATVNLTKGEHILRFTVTGDWMDIDYIEFTSDGIDPNPICKDDDGNPLDCKTKIVPVGVNFAASASREFNVFSVTGKFLGDVNMAEGGMAASLKAAGFAKGVYMVRDGNGGRAFRVQVAR